MVAGAEGAHLPALAFLGAIGNKLWLRTCHHPPLLDPTEVPRFAPAALNRPTGTARQHCIHVGRVEGDCALAADSGRDLAKERVGKRCLHRKNVGDGEAGQHRAHPARDVESDAACRHDAPMIGIKRRDATDRETITPMGIRHGIGSRHDPGKRCHIHRLLKDLVIHAPDQILVGINDRRHAHCAARLDPPRGGVDPGEASGVHGRSPLHVHDAGCRPGAVDVLGHFQRGIGRALRLAGRGMASDVDRLTP